MRNPLKKRLFKEILSEWGKYFAIFLFMGGTIAFVSGFLAASRNLQIAYDESFEKYNIEDGHFVLSKKADEKLTGKIEKKCHILLYPDYYLEENASVGDRENKKEEVTLRLFRNREDVNGICLLEGKLPEEEQEIALERLFLIKNNLEIGSRVRIGETDFKVCGIVAFSDYSTGYQDNNDMMFDSIKFGCGLITKQDFAKLGEASLHYSYAWKYKKGMPESEEEEKEISSDMAEDIYMAALEEETDLDVFFASLRK